MQMKLIKQQSASALKPREKKTTQALNQPVIYPVDGYKLLNELSIGGFGCVYKAIEMKTNRPVAIKYSKENMEKEYRILNQLQNCQGVPQVYNFGQLNNTYYIVMELLNEDMYTISSKQKCFSIKTTILIAIKIIQVLSQIHKNGIRHRDIKPQNLMTKYSDSTIYLIDFGISLLQNDPLPDKYVDGTILYDPRIVHRRQEYRFIDDIEMAGYCLVDLLKGQLPWYKYIEGRESRIMQMKQEFLDAKSTNQLPIYPIFQFVEQNQNNDIPDHNKLITQLREVLQKQNIIEDYIYDWSSNELIPTPQFKARTVSFQSQKSKFQPENQEQNIALEGQIQFVNDQKYKFMK
ncbi:unnamed protein product (macronuclear) [Paramecium tetraurelia]|uniref:Casein kinase I n=1 Tax=Paramecium tetraurelia TaxID=5888 RepID=A0CTF4_PARTE|nr:uncharacterized protein GSPATT00010305001 [Paramecium tetraurelia]CAK74071.1 unnamed protein product [Paramecium tetraurelia]|eukprot:XP_001441468.1 hypothetical protein (macronuclear) [Paramecium tetraurelia strain d4-2]